jgi:serine/threonine protein kinase
LRQENLIPILAAGSIGEVRYVIMPRRRGVTLHRLKQRLQARGLRLPAVFGAALFAQGQLGLSALHGLCDQTGTALGLAHGDICPANLLLTAEGTLVILDFLAEPLGPRLSLTGEPDEPLATFAADQAALLQVLADLLGPLPWFPGKDPESLAAKVPPGAIGAYLAEQNLLSTPAAAWPLLDLPQERRALLTESCNLSW